MDIYVGNLPYSATEEELGELFSSFGPIKRTTIIKDRETGQSKGFGFVVLADESQVQAAIEAINGSEISGRVLKAKPSEPKPRLKPGGSSDSGERTPYSGGGGGQPRRQSSNNFGGGGHYSDNGPRGKYGGGKSKGSQKGKRKQKGGYDGGW